MAKTQPRIPAMDILQENPATGYVIKAYISTLAAVPDGATYAGIFEPNAQLQIAAGTAEGYFVNKGTTAVPSFKEITNAA